MQKKNTVPGILGAIFTLWVLSAIFAAIDNASDIMDNPVTGIVVLVIIIGCTYAVFSYIRRIKCPACGSRIHKVIDTRVTETGTSSYTETHRITHYTPDGDEKGYSEYDEEVPCNTYTTHQTHKCGKCDYTWESS
jgi:hypothetical protein